MESRTIEAKNPSSETYESLRAIISSERKRLRLTQTDVAGRIGRSRKWFSDFERGAVVPSATSVFALAASLGIIISIAPGFDQFGNQIVPSGQVNDREEQPSGRR